MKRLTISDIFKIGFVLLSLVACYYSLEKRVSLLENNQQNYYYQFSRLEDKVDKIYTILVEEKS